MRVGRVDDSAAVCLIDELPDVALEVAASQGYSGSPHTLAFCTGLRNCPFGAADRGQCGELAGANFEQSLIRAASPRAI
jgi:hypothetical protein